MIATNIVCKMSITISNRFLMNDFLMINNRTVANGNHFTSTKTIIWYILYFVQAKPNQTKLTTS